MLGACAGPSVPREDAWRAGIRAAFGIDGPAPELAPAAHGSFAPEPGIVAERVTYGTQFGMRVPAIVYRPERPAGRVPAIVIVNGHGGDKYAWYAFYAGVLYARAGAVVLTYDPTGEGERNGLRRSGTREHDKIEDPERLGPRLAGLMATDLMQAVSYLRERPDVDAARIAACGYSLGSFVVAIGGALDTRIRACVLAGGGNLDGPGEYWDHTKPMCTGTPYGTLAFLGDRPAVLYALHAARGPTLMWNGRKDEVVKIAADADGFFADLRRRTAVLRDSEDGLFEFGFDADAGSGHRPFFVTRPVASWLERELDLPGWTSEVVAHLPETRVGEWAKEQGVAIDAYYATDHHEGGAVVLEEGVPALGREALSVFTAEEWEKEKDRMVHERWRERVRR